MKAMEMLRSVGRVAFGVSVFGLTFALACAGIGALLPFPDVPLVEAKLRFFKAHANEYDTLFIGSSRVYHQILPSLFDELTGRKGFKTRSFNAAIDGLRPPEMNYYVEQLLKCGPRNLRWVFIENGAVRVPLDADKLHTIRNVYWHDWKRLALIYRVALAARKPPRKAKLRNVIESYLEQWEKFDDHLDPFLKNVTNLGRASTFTERLLTRNRPPDLTAAVLGPHGDGYRKTGRDETILPQNLAMLQKEVAARRAKPAEVGYADRVSQSAFEGILEEFEKLGATTVQLVTPTTGSRKFLLVSAGKKKRIVLDYSDVEKYATLFDPQYRLDPDHLNHAGAEIFTRLLVDEFTHQLNGSK
jgi:hypothetical protein